MGLMDRGGSGKRPMYAGQIFTANPWRGILRIQKWPRKAKVTRTPHLARLQSDLTRAVQWMKALKARERTPMREAVDEHNRLNTGVRGSARIRARDLEIMSIYGRLMAFAESGGKMIHTRAQAMEISIALDWLNPQVGSLATRTPQGWRPTWPCEVGAVMTNTLQGETSACCPAASYPPLSKLADS